MSKVSIKLTEAENPNYNGDNLYVITPGGDYIYECRVQNTVMHGKDSYIVWELLLIAGRNYADDNDTDMTWVTPDAFVEDVQSDSFSQYFIVEGFEAAAKANSYKVINNEKVKNLHITQAHI